MPNHFNLRVYDAACELSRVVHECLEAHDVTRVPGLRGQHIEEDEAHRRNERSERRERSSPAPNS